MVKNGPLIRRTMKRHGRKTGGRPLWFWLDSKLSLYVLLVLAVACHPRPIEELVLADVAVKAAQKVKADALAPDLFRKAENYFLRARRDYTEGYYDSCRKHANEARVFAEQAEFKALQKQSQLKDKTFDEDFGVPPGSTPPPDGIQ